MLRHPPCRQGRSSLFHPARTARRTSRQTASGLPDISSARGLFFPELDRTASAIHLSENNVLSADDCHYVCNHVTACHLIQRSHMGKARRADFHAVRFVRAVGNKIDAKLALGMLDGSIGLASRHMHTLGEQLE